LFGAGVLVVDGLGSMVAYQAQHPSHSGFMVFFAVQSSGIPPVLLTGGADTKLRIDKTLIPAASAESLLGV